MANYPVPYQNNWGYGGIGTQMVPQYAQSSMTQAPAVQQTQNQQGGIGLKWVDGEVGAKAYQLPPGWPCNQPVALWDVNDRVIYLKSINPMGMPNPLQKARYTLDTDRTEPVIHAGSGSAEPVHDMSDYVRKDDMERMKTELMEAIGNIGSAGTAAKKTSGKVE